MNQTPKKSLVIDDSMTSLRKAIRKFLEKKFGVKYDELPEGSASDPTPPLEKP